MMNKDLFDEEESERLKVRGMALGAANRFTDLELARMVAFDIARKGDGTCNADQVGRRLKALYNIETLGPATGSLFKTPVWRWTGRFVQSARTTNHRRRIMVWELVR